MKTNNAECYELAHQIGYTAHKLGDDLCSQPKLSEGAYEFWYCSAFNAGWEQSRFDKVLENYYREIDDD